MILYCNHDVSPGALSNELPSFSRYVLVCILQASSSEAGNSEGLEGINNRTTNLAGNLITTTTPPLPATSLVPQLPTMPGLGAEGKEDVTTSPAADAQAAKVTVAQHCLSPAYEAAPTAGVAHHYVFNLAEVTLSDETLYFKLVLVCSQLGCNIIGWMTWNVESVRCTFEI